MTKTKKVLLAILILFVCVFVILSVLVSLFGKKVVEAAIEQNLKIKTRLGSISLGLPLSISLKDIEIGSLIKADKISFSPNLLGFLAGKVVLNGLTLINPVINLEESVDGSLNLPQYQHPFIFLTGLVVKNGKINFIDRKIGPAGLFTRVDKIDAVISKDMFPLTSLNIKFKLSAYLADASSKELGSAEASGWIDFGKKDMDATLRLNDLEVTHFAPYYGNLLSNRKLLSAKLNLTAEPKAKNNDLNISTNFKLSNLVYAQEEPQEEGQLPQLDLVKNTLDLFTDKQGNLILDFTINAKLDNPTISIAELKKTILQAAIRNLSNQRPEDLIGKVIDTIEKYKDFGKELKDIFKKE